MIKEVGAFMPMDIEHFAADIEELRQEIINNSEKAEEGEDAIILEVINVIQEEMAKRKGKVKKKDIQSEVRFLAYLNLFTTIMDGGFEDEFEDMDFDDEFDEEE